MSFIVDGENLRITMHRGDTGSFIVHLDGWDFSSDDRALFCVRDGSNREIKHVEFVPDSNGDYEIAFVNSDTDTLTPGTYRWDVRVSIDAYFDQDPKIVDGDQVITPDEFITDSGQGRSGQLIILSTVGDI